MTDPAASVPHRGASRPAVTCMSMEPSFSNVLSACDARWPQLHDAALRRAHAVARDGGSWCLVSRWRQGATLDENWEQHRVVVDGFRPTIEVQTLMAHFRGDRGSRTRFEPWMFLARPDGKVKRWVAEWLMQRQPDLGFWGDGIATHVLTAGYSRCIGAFQPCALANAIRESSAERAGFLGFDLPASSIEALARTAYVGSVGRELQGRELSKPR